MVSDEISDFVEVELDFACAEHAPSMRNTIISTVRCLRIIRNITKYHKIQLNVMKCYEIIWNLMKYQISSK